MEKQLPKNWVEVQIKDVAHTTSGGTPKTSRKDYWGGDIPWINSGKLKDKIIDTPSKYITELGLKESSAKLFPIDTIVIALTGATTGKVGLLKIKTSTNQSVTGIFPNDYFESKIMFYQLQDLRNIILSKALGTAQPHINKKIVDETKVKLPPLAEQKRIVAKLDNLFAELDIIKERLANIPALLKNFRQSVLNQAVTGKLTEEWREGKEFVNLKLDSNGKYELGFNFRVPENWKVYPIGNVFSFQQGMQIAKNTRLKKPGNNRLPILRIKNYHDGFIKDVEYVSITEKSLIAEKEDIILTRTGESRGWVLTGYRGVFHNNTFRINFPKDKVEGRYLEFFLNQSEVQAFIKFNSGRTGQPDLTHKSFGPCPFILPPQEEQQEIVKRVDTLFKQADNIQTHYEALVKRIEVVPQAILAKAFKGELVPQLPTDGDAKELLAEIKKLKESVAPKKKKRVVKK